MSATAPAPAASRSKAPEPHVRHPHGALLHLLQQDDANPHSAVTPLRPPVAAPPVRSATLGDCSPLMRVARLALVLVLASLCGLIRVHYSLLPSANVMQQWQQRWAPSSAPLHEYGIDVRGVLPTGAASRTADEWSEYECVAWREASTCTHPATSEEQEQQSRDCDERISLSKHRMGGFCELRHSRTGERKQVLLISHPPCESSSNKNNSSTFTSADTNAHFRCADFHTLLSFADRAAAFEFDPSFSYGKCRQALIDGQVNVNQIRYASSRKIRFERGIVIVQSSSRTPRGSEAELTRAHELIERLRCTECALPIELWLSSPYESESSDSQALLQRTARAQGVYLRQTKTTGRQGTPASDGQSAKAYAAFYSAFDKVLVLDLEGLAATVDLGNPGHLFTAKAFAETGALFWQAENVIEAKESAGFLVRALFGLNSDPAAAPLFHQDTGRMLIDRRRNHKALNTLMFFVEHREELDALEVVNTANDLYQLAWASTNSSYHAMLAP